MEAAERLSVHGSSGGTSAGFPPRVQRGAPDHHGPGTLAEGSLSGRGLVGSGNLGRWPGVQRGLQRRHVQQPVSRLYGWSCTTPHTHQVLHSHASWSRNTLTHADGKPNTTRTGRHAASLL